MPKTGLRAFICSFSVSLFAVMAANRIFAPQKPLETPPLDISGKNIVLFLKNNGVPKIPVKKIALSILPEITPETPDEANVPSVEDAPEVIMAGKDELIDFPLEFEPLAPQPEKITVDTAAEPLVLADVLYSEDHPLETPEIEAVPIYAPEQESPKIAAAPVYQPAPSAAEVPKTVSLPDSVGISPQKVVDPDAAALRLARAETAAAIPLQKKSGATAKQRKAVIGDPQALNHIAMADSNIPIESVERNAEETVAAQKDAKKWKAMNDSPWIVAKSNAGGKNQLAAKDLTAAADKEISQALYAQNNRSGVQIASETVKNLIIPIPEDILNDDNLTPKLAYPSTSEDAAKEKIIDERIKKQELVKKEKKEPLLSPIEEEVSLDAPVVDLPVQETPLPTTKQAAKTVADKPVKETEKGGIINALNSIFDRSAEAVNDAKERAIAKAKARRSLKQKRAQSRPVSIMPKEIRLSFQPNRAEISGQTLRWVQAFASKAAASPDLALEIRIDGTSSMVLQQKRLNLLHNILSNKGVEYSKINTVFTAREPNSFILRTINLENNSKGKTQGTKNGAAGYIQW